MSEPSKALRLAADAAREAYTAARASHSREELAATTAMDAEGATDAFLDAGTDTHRLVDLAAATPAIAAELAELVRNSASPAQPRACRAVTAGAAPH
jgi:hypothetical protein